MQQFGTKRTLSFCLNDLADAEMFAAGLSDVFHQRVLIVENDPSVADILRRFVVENGGEVVSELACALKALAFVSTNPHIDVVLVEADMANDLALPLVRQLERRKLHTVWVIGHDGYFVPTRDAEPTPLVYRLAGDPENVMRVSMETVQTH